MLAALLACAGVLPAGALSDGACQAAGGGCEGALPGGAREVDPGETEVEHAGDPDATLSLVQMAAKKHRAPPASSISADVAPPGAPREAEAEEAEKAQEEDPRIQERLRMEVARLLAEDPTNETLQLFASRTEAIIVSCEDVETYKREGGYNAKPCWQVVAEGKCYNWPYYVECAKTCCNCCIGCRKCTKECYDLAGMQKCETAYYNSQYAACYGVLKGQCRATCGDCTSDCSPNRSGRDENGRRCRAPLKTAGL